MKRYWWLLALPYVVTIATDGYIGTGGVVKTYHSEVINGTAITCERDCDWLADLAYALNQAHEQRTKSVTIAPFPDKNDDAYVCGPNDCGKEPTRYIPPPGDFFRDSIIDMTKDACSYHCGKKP